ncbi:MAG: TAXI family TRAP transporter solute-binding subunit [Tistlia sp.]|uniref:TAXI family TRAP transporter solute-binding subunit n=1 Tax=Tistlia sp. TaxID=3057121 RepID=UPI0034A3E1B2
MDSSRRALARGLFGGLALLAAVGLAAETARAETRVTYKSAKSTSSYYQMGVQIAEAVARATGGEIVVSGEESQGSVQNVKEAAKRGGSYVFTTPPGLVKLAAGGKAMFEGDDTAPYQEIRGLFPIPFLTMHLVVREDAGIDGWDDLAGKTLLIGKGSFGASEGAKYLGLFGLEGKVELADAELNSAVPALQNGQIDGFVTAGSHPAPNVMEAAAGTGIKLLSMSDEQIALTGRDKLVIPAGTYDGVETDVATTTLPVAAYATAAMAEETAYQLTKGFWEAKAEMAETAPWWDAITPDLLAVLGAELHPGAARYYKEAGIELPAS